MHSDKIFILDKGQLKEEGKFIDLKQFKGI